MKIILAQRISLYFSIYSSSVLLFIHQYQVTQKHLSSNKGSINKVALRPALRYLKEKNQCVFFDFFKTNIFFLSQCSIHTYIHKVSKLSPLLSICVSNATYRYFFLSNIEKSRTPSVLVTVRNTLNYCTKWHIVVPYNLMSSIVALRQLVKDRLVVFFRLSVTYLKEYFISEL